MTRIERIANSERYLDMAKANNLRAEDKAAELKQLNRSIFRPVVVWNKVSLAFCSSSLINPIPRSRLKCFRLGR
jgi:hypothetical protein